MIPKTGMNDEWDGINQQIKDAEKQFESHLQVVKRELKCSSVVYKDMNKDIYQMEVPKSVKVPQSWIQMSTTAVRIKGCTPHLALRLNPSMSCRKLLVTGTTRSRI